MYDSTFSSKNSPTRPAASIQTKLQVNQAGDKYEQEADRVADQVVNSASTQQPALQKKCAACEKEESVQNKPILQKMEEEEVRSKAQLATKKEDIQTKKDSQSSESVSGDVQTKIEQSKGAGSPLSSSTKSFMESRIGADFSNVKIHNDSRAHKLSAKLNAQAFAVGNNVFFNKGKFNPETQSGKHLLAHELAHTVQQTSKSIRLKRGKNTWKKVNKGNKKKWGKKTGTFSPKKLNASGVFSRTLVKFLARLFQHNIYDHPYQQGVQVLDYLESSSSFIKAARYLDKHYAKRRSAGIQFEAVKTGSRFITKGSLVSETSSSKARKLEKDTIQIDDFYMIEEAYEHSNNPEQALVFASAIMHETAHALRHAKGSNNKYRGVAGYLFDELKTRELEEKMLKELTKGSHQSTKHFLANSELKEMLKRLIGMASVKGPSPVEKLVEVGKSEISGAHMSYLEKYLWQKQFSTVKKEFNKLVRRLRPDKNKHLQLVKITGFEKKPLSPQFESLVKLGTYIQNQHGIKKTMPNAEDIPRLIQYLDFGGLKKMLKQQKLSRHEKYMVLYLSLISLVLQKQRLQKHRKDNSPDESQANQILKKYLGINKTYKQIIRKNMKK